jgi:hypothetical protein
VNKLLTVDLNLAKPSSKGLPLDFKKWEMGHE